MYIILELGNSIFLFLIAVGFFLNMDIHENTDSLFLKKLTQEED